MTALLSIIAVILSVLSIKQSSDVKERLDTIERRNRELAKARKQNAEALGSVMSQSQASTTSLQSGAHELHNIQPVKQESPQEEKLTTSVPVRDKVEPYKESAFVLWLKEDWLLKLGGVLVLMGVLFFLSLAFEYIGPSGKIAVGYLFGIAFMSFGFWYAKKQIIAGGTIHLIGAIIIIISSYVAHQPDFQVFNAYFSMVMMFLTTVCVALTSFMYKRAPLAHLALFMAGIVPVLTHVPGVTFFDILVYLAVVIVGVVWLAFVTRWRSLILMSLVIVMMYSASYITGGLGDSPLLAKEVILVALFGALFYITSLFSILRTEGYVIKDDGIVALLNAGFALMWITSQANPELSPILIATVGLIYAAGFFFVYKITNVYTSFLVYGGVALGMLTTAIMLEISGRALAVTLLLMGGAVSYFTYYLSRNVQITKVMSFFNVLPLLYVIVSIGNIARLSYPQHFLIEAWQDFLIIGVALVVYYSLYKYFSDKNKDLSYTALTVVVLLVMDIVWQVLHLVTTSYFATELSLLIIGIGLTMFIYRLTNDNETTEKTAIINFFALVSLFGSLASLNSSKDWFAVSFGIAISYYLYFFFGNKIKTIAYTGLASGLFLIAISIWQLAHLIIPSAGLAAFVSIFIYTVVGLSELWKGTRDNNDTRIKIARVWLGFVAARVILIDAWVTGNIAVGVLICIVTGILLLSSAFIIKKTTSTDN